VELLLPTLGVVVELVNVGAGVVVAVLLAVVAAAAEGGLVVAPPPQPDTPMTSAHTPKPMTDLQDPSPTRSPYHRQLSRRKFLRKAGTSYVSGSEDGVSLEGVVHDPALTRSAGVPCDAARLHRSDPSHIPQVRR
jgi:hypothetical protein